MEKILLIGDDSHLLATRAAVLAKTGASVTSCNAKEFDALSDPDPFSLVVLCHSLTPAASRRIGDEVRRRWPQSRLLLVLKGIGDPSSFETHVDATAPAAEPAKLIAIATSLLAKSPQSPKRLPKGPRLVDRPPCPDLP